MRRIIALGIIAAATAVAAHGSDGPGTAPPAPAGTAPLPAPGSVPWARTDDRHRRLVERMLASSHWPMRAIALLRLERFDTAGVESFVRARLSDDAWQVRCFAFRGAHRLGLVVDPATLAAEPDARVIRAALRHGVRLDPARIATGARELLRTPALDELLLGLEIACASDDAVLRGEASRRLRPLLANMDDTIALRASARLGRMLDVAPAPRDAAGWRAWLETQPNGPALPAPPAAGPAPVRPDPPLVASLDDVAFSRFVDYLDGLRQRDLDLAIVMDATMSMTPMLHEARVGVDGLILFLSDVSRTMRLAFVAYRDHDNRPVWEGEAFTTDIAAIRRFLFALRISGGADLPEAVLDGLTACGRLDWRRDAVKEIVLVGDARPHEDDGYRIRDLLENFVGKGIVAHTVHVPMRPNDADLRSIPPRAAEFRREQIAEHNALTARAFTEIAGLAGGEAVTLDDPDRLVPAIMHLTIAPAWWDAFDAFYDDYVVLCR